MEKKPQLIKLGLQIRDIREDQGYTQEAFAAEAGIDRSYIGSIERGERNIAALNLIKIAQALHIEVGELFPPIKKLVAKNLI